METPLEAKGHEETLVERNPEGENLEDANQPSDIPFSKSLVDEAYQEEDTRMMSILEIPFLNMK